MHTAFDVKKRMFRVTSGGREIDPYELLDWSERDRLGVLIDRPVGALGAGLMILLAASAFYDVVGKKRRQRPIYPEIYLFHVGGPWGVFTNFDFWPDHKEIFLPSDPVEVLSAVNNRGITHLLVVNQMSAVAEHRFKEPEAALDRLKRCWAYEPAGSVVDGDVVITTSDMSLLENYTRVLDMDIFLDRVTVGEKAMLRVGAKSDEEDQRSYEISRKRLVRELDKGAPSYRKAATRISAALAAGTFSERFRAISGQDALQMLGRGPD